MLDGLALLKRRALRKGVWFRALTRVERSIYDLTLRTVSIIRSRKLLKIVRTIMSKLREALESPVSILTRKIGRLLAKQIAQIACSWGYPEASRWILDERFARFLAICYMNTISIIPTYKNTDNIGPLTR